MRKVLKIILYAFGGIIVLLAGVIVWVITPSGKRFVRSKAVAFLHNKLKTEVYIGAVEYSFPKMIGLKDVLFKDQAQDTLLSVHELKIDVDMLALLSKKVSVNQLLIDSMYVHVYRRMPDTNFNFTYIIDAFASKDPKPADTAKKDKSSPFVFDVGRVKLDEIHVRFEDETGGNHLVIDLRHLQIRMRELDPGKMVFRLKSLEVDGLHTSFRQDTSYIVSHDTTKAAMPAIALDELKLHDIAVNFHSTLSNFLMDVQLTRLETHPRKIDLQGQDIQIKDLLMDTTTAKIVVGKSSEVPKKIDNAVDTIAQQSWKMSADAIQFAAINVQMDNEGRPRQPKGMDYAHLNVAGLNFTANNISYAADAVSGNIRHLSLKEQSGLDLQELRTVFSYNEKGAYLRQLYVQTSYSLLQDDLEVSYPSLDALKHNLQQLQLKVSLKNSVVGTPDILIFAPQLAQQDFFRANSTARFHLDAALNGYLNNLDIHQFRLAGLANTYVALNGRLSGLPAAAKLNYDLNVQQLRSSREDIARVVPPKALVAIRLPNLFSLNGRISGNTKDYNTLLWLKSTDGNAFIKGTIAMSGGKGNEHYDMIVQTQQLNVGRIIKKDTLIGPVTADLKVKGRSFDVKSMTAALDGSVKSALLKGYNYNGITFKGSVAHQQGNIALNSIDSNAKLNMSAHADFAGKYPGLVTHIHIDNIDFQALKLTSNNLKLQTDIDADVPVLNPDYPEGTVLIDRPIVAADNKFYLLDSLYIASKPSADSGQNIKLNLEFLQASITGQLPLTKAGDVIMEHINRHYSMLPAGIGRSDSAKAVSMEQRPKPASDSVQALPAVYSLDVKASLEQTPSLYAFVPQLKDIDTVKIDAHVDQNSLGLNLLAPRVLYGTNLLQKATVVVNERDSGLTYNIGLEKYENGSIQLVNTTVKGNVDVNVINASVHTNDVDNKERFAFDVSLNRQDSAQALQLGSNLLLNYKKWTVSQPNKIVFGPGGFYVDNFKISSAASSIAVTSTPAAFNAPLNAEISNFQVSDITSFISKDTLFADGVLNGKAVVSQFKPNLAFDADFKLSNIVVMRDTVGDIALQANSKDGNAITANIAISGQQNDIQLAGNYYMTTPVNGNSFDFDLAIKALNVRSIEGLTQYQIRNTSGFVRGDLKIAGTVKSPAISGELHTDQLKTNVKMLNATFSMPQEKIAFTETGVAFQRFNVIDSSGNKLTLDGGIQTKDYKNMILDLGINARNWRASHSTMVDNKLFYGDLYLTTKLDIQGPLTKPDVSGNISIEKGTKMSFALPESNQSFEDQAGIVVFTDEKTEELKRRMHIQETPDTVKALSISPGSAINVNISTDEKAEFNVVIDQATGDFLRVRGKASLNTAIDPGGNLSLNGIYELNEGNYELNYNLIKRRFNIQKGSTITFAGDPLNAEVDVKAVYVTNVAPYDLVERQVPDPSQLVYYRQALPFNVVLSMHGPLMQPYLGFDISLPENNAYRLSADAVELVQAKLNQLRTDTSELNKQVFALLLLNRFITDDPFSSDDGGGGFAFTAKQSVSRFIGEQLNQFANQLVKGVDLSVDLASTEDYTTGERRERTDLNVAASKRLLDDRLKITVGNNFELEGPQTNNNDQNSSLIPGNLAADYNLTQDGRYSVRGYRVNQDRGVIQGFVTETGLNFIVTLDYNKFRNLFIKRKKIMPDKQQSDTKGQTGDKPAGTTN